MPPELINPRQDLTVDPNHGQSRTGSRLGESTRSHGLWTETNVTTDDEQPGMDDELSSAWYDCQHSVSQTDRKNQPYLKDAAPLLRPTIFSGSRRAARLSGDTNWRNIRFRSVGSEAVKRTSSKTHLKDAAPMRRPTIFCGSRRAASISQRHEFAEYPVQAIAIAPKVPFRNVRLVFDSHR
ncbi:uncharacterized protein LAESUDRAFT_517158 [Laetiporus sulphureus 93-53]|uniref:Uncharacterized protein n=1 Tax=Laetiporus sulphureus 93-53 TaxID=1314785 RepID=A0A165G1I5_9APHY|nr:uncharacterized protein LAESUDRAFT_517158 [Laetiporus sulphureus 93-53]KZT09704.1 hypothetical protein LAESUDRAFT_517158 [Laetiporus sulphureus 93-53]